MTWFFAVLIVLAIGGIALVAAGHGDSLAPAYDDHPDVELPAEGLTGDDLRGVRFTSAVMGYRPSEVDALIERLARELDVRDARLVTEDAGPMGRTDERTTDDRAHGGSTAGRDPGRDPGRDADDG